MSAVESRLAATLAKHQRDGASYRCRCGWEWSETPTWACGKEKRFERDLVTHQAAVIASSADLAVIELPSGEPATDVYGKPITDFLHQGRTVMYIDPAEPGYVGKPYVGPYDVQMMRGASGQRWTPDSAVEFAGALIATARAAKAAEGVDRD
ncbi:hypothetical protein [Tsukamurella tyrosinosolvens]|uniref:hypothetical protein n=1 Tax=Tsukamurella tyrosinosolvens TaxID=57704 RepID=UPI002DD437DA|nr:hypothetical protein [Tsukamurella tyrosinosolvens]MEC4616284.1 hypothetical protein [Tsukamurella tyrosinosolvens]